MTTDKQRAKKVEQAIEGVLRWLGFLQQYSLRVSFVDEFNEKPDDEQPDCRSQTGYPYSWAHFVWRRHSADHADQETLEEIAAHEAFHVLLFAPLDAVLKGKLSAKDWARYGEQQERIVDQVSHYLARRRPRYGYHPSGVPNTSNTAKEKRKRSVR